jgi:hypothetical protein
VKEYCEPTYIFRSDKEKPQSKYYHMQASFLGTYGNIASANFLHAAVILQVCKHETQLNVAGDDGIIILTKDNEGYFRYAASLLGYLQMEKTYPSDSANALHLKRELLIDDYGILRKGQIFLLPSLEFPINQKLVDPKYPFIKHMTKEERRTSAASTVLPSILSFNQCDHTDEERSNFLDFLTDFYFQHGLPLAGHLPDGYTSDARVVLRIDRDCICDDPLAYTRKHFSFGSVIYKYRDYLPYDSDDIDDRTFFSNSQSKLSYLVSIGYLTSRTVPKLYTKDKEIDEAITMLLARRKPPLVYKYVINKASILL